MKVIVVLVQLAELAGFMGCTQDQHPVKSALERINDGAEPHEVVEAMRQAVEAKVPRGDMREMFFKQAWERRGGGQKRRRRALTGSAAAARKAWEEMQDD